MLQRAPETVTIDGLEIPGTAFTSLDGFCEWFGRLGEHAPRASYLAGKIHIEMTPQSFRHHEPLVDEVNSVLRVLTRELDLGQYFFPPSWVVCEEVGLSTEPDGFLVTWDRFESGRFKIDPRREHRALGAPTFAFETVSARSRDKDVTDLARLYFEAGVEEYWLADARDPKRLEFRILGRGPRGFVARRPSRGWTRSAVFGRSFRLRRQLNRAGNPEFFLDVR